MKKGTTKDTISKIKREEEKKGASKLVQNDDDYNAGSEDEEQMKSGVVKEQTVSSSNKPQGLRDLLDSIPADSKPKQHKQVSHQEKKQKQKDSKPMFINSKNKGNASEIDAEIKKKQAEKKSNEPTKKIYDTQGLMKTAKENEKIKAPKKSYLDADIQKKYQEEKQEDISKPEFKNLKIGDKNFVELNKNEDVRFYF